MSILILMKSLRFWLVTMFAICSLSACGGGGGGGGGSSVATADIYVGAYSDSGVDGGGDSGAGAGGGAGDGAPGVGGLVTITDSSGKAVTTTTNVNGQYKVSVTGFVTPLVATVSKNGRVLTSFTTATPVVGRTVLINITGLTDKVASDLVGLSGQVGAIKLTANIILQQAANINSVIRSVNSSIASLLAANGLNPSTFDPMTTKLVTNHTGYDAVLDALNITNGGNVPTRIVPLTPLEAAKQFFKGLRDTAGAYSNTSNTGDLDSAGDKLNTAISAATSPIDEDVLKILGNFSDAEKMYDRFRSGSSSVVFLNAGNLVFGQTTTRNSAGTTVAPGFGYEYGCELAQVSTTVTASGDTDTAIYRFAGSIALSATTSLPPLGSSSVNAFSCYGQFVSGRLFATALNDGASRWNRITFLPQTDGSFKYVSQTRKRGYDITGLYADTVTFSISVRDGSAKFGTLTRTRDVNGDISAMTVNGQLSPGFKRLKNRTVAEWQSFSHQTVSLNLSEVSGVGTKTANLAGNITLVKADGSVASSGLIAPGSTMVNRDDLVESNTYFTSLFTGSSPCPPGFTQSGSAPFISCFGSVTTTTTLSKLSAMDLNIAVAAPNVKFEGSFKAADAKRDSTGKDASFQPTSASFAGKVYEGDGSGGYRLLLDGTITALQSNRDTVNTSAPESATNFLKNTLDFTGKLLLKDRPETLLTIKAQNNSFDTQDFTSEFIFDGGWGFSIAGSKNDTLRTGSTNFTSTTGITFTIPRNASTIPQKFYKGTLELGNITLSTKRISYIDGTFEQF